MTNIQSNISSFELYLVPHAELLYQVINNTISRSSTLSEPQHGLGVYTFLLTKNCSFICNLLVLIRRRRLHRSLSNVISAAAGDRSTFTVLLVTPPCCHRTYPSQSTVTDLTLKDTRSKRTKLMNY